MKPDHALALIGLGYLALFGTAVTFIVRKICHGSK